MARDGWERWVDGLREQAERSGITIFQTHAFCYRTAESTDFTIDRPWFEERIRRSITASRMLGAEWTVIHPADFSRDPEYSAEKCKAFNCEYWKPFVELGVRCGVGIAFENMFQSGFSQRYCSEVDEIIGLEALKDIGYSHDFAYELKQATQTLPPELCGEMLRFLYDLGMNLIERAAVCEN